MKNEDIKNRLYELIANIITKILVTIGVIIYGTFAILSKLMKVFK